MSFVDGGQLLSQGLEQAGDAFLELRRGALLTLLLGADHLDNLASALHQIGEKYGLGIGQRAGCDPGGLGEVSDDRGIDRIGLGPLAERLGEAANLSWIDDNDCEPGGGEAGGDHGLEAAGRLEGDEVGCERLEPFDQFIEPGRGTRDKEGFSARTHGDVEAVLGDIDTDDDLIHADPSLPNRARSAAPATVRVR